MHWDIINWAVYISGAHTCTHISWTRNWWKHTHTAIIFMREIFQEAIKHEATQFRWFFHSALLLCEHFPFWFDGLIVPRLGIDLYSHITWYFSQRAPWLFIPSAYNLWPSKQYFQLKSHKWQCLQSSLSSNDDLSQKVEKKIASLAEWIGKPRTANKFEYLIFIQIMDKIVGGSNFHVTIKAIHYDDSSSVSYLKESLFLRLLMLCTVVLSSMYFIWKYILYALSWVAEIDSKKRKWK